MVLLGISLVGLLSWIWRLQRRMDGIYLLLERLGESTHSDNFEQLLSTILAQSDESMRRIQYLQRQGEQMESRLADTLHKRALLRYNPFEDAGGDQSFVLALLDDHNSGLIISSLHAREGTRIYLKPIEQGIAGYTLSEEEKKVLQQAVQHR